jgi:lysyl-tRNA synthetase class 1
VDFTRGMGKLSWKAGEFAARWSALKISFEAYGKDISDSVRVNDRISREILHYEPPIHVQYEMFLDKTGKKMSKSIGNVFTPQIWFKYASPQSLILLTLKRFIGTRNISIEDIPNYMDEFDSLEDIYFEIKNITDKKVSTKLKGLYNYCWFLNPPKKPTIHIQYNLLLNLSRFAPKQNQRKFIMEKLKKYGFHINNDVLIELEKRIGYALNWIRDFSKDMAIEINLNSKEISAIEDLIKLISVAKNAEEIQQAIFQNARKNGLKPKTLFKKLYMILLGEKSGPKLGSYIFTIGKKRTIESLKKIMK